MAPTGLLPSEEGTSLNVLGTFTSGPRPEPGHGNVCSACAAVHGGGRVGETPRRRMGGILSNHGMIG